MDIEFVRPSPDEWQKVRDLRIRAVTEEPRAFGKTPEEERNTPEDVWRKRLEEQSYLVASEGGNFVGLISVVPEPNEKSKHVANIYSVYVVPDVRGKGVARQLLTRAMTDAKKKYPSIIKFNLHVATTQPVAAKLYESMGFEKAGLRKKDLLVNGEFVDKVIMEKFLD